MVGKVAKVFMSILRNKLTSIAGIVTILMGMFGCTPDMSDDPVPYQPFPNIQLNLNLPQYISLKSVGATLTLDGGVRGIIVYCLNTGVYRAYERNCTFHPNDACATVNIDPSKLFMVDSCCGSNFEFSEGNPNGGVAWRPLVQYSAIYDGAILTITDEVINN